MIHKAILLSAGFGKRMRPITESIPKPLLPIAGIPIIQHTLSKLSSAGVKEVVINLHYMSHLIKEEIARNPAEIKISFSEEPTILGTAGGIRAAASILGDDEFIVINSDIITEINLDEAVRFHKKKEALCTMVLRKDIDVDSYGPVEIDHEGKIRRFLGIPGHSNKLLSKYMFTGIQIIDLNFLDEIPMDQYCDISREIFPRLAQEGAKIYGYITDEDWMDIGEPDRYIKANHQYLKKFNIYLPEIGDGVKIIPPVSIGKNIHIEDSVILGPNCSIGEKCKIHRGVSVMDSVIMKGVSVGEGANIKASIIGRWVTIPPRDILVKKMVASVKGKTLIKSF